MFEISDEDDKSQPKTTQFYGATSWVTAANYASWTTYTFLPSILPGTMYINPTLGKTYVFQNGQWILI